MRTSINFSARAWVFMKEDIKILDIKKYRYAIIFKDIDT